MNSLAHSDACSVSIPTELAVVGSYRIVEIEGGFGGPGWTWRFRVEELFPGGRFLFWSWGPSWKTVYDNAERDHCRAYIARQGRYERVVETFAPTQPEDGPEVVL